MTTWLNILPSFFAKQWNHFFKKVEGALVYFSPVYVSKKNILFSPIVAVVSLVLCFVFFGLALGSFFFLFANLLVIYFIFTKVYGIRLDTSEVYVVR